MEKDKLISICDMIIKDVKDNAANFDGKPFTGKTMAEYMGNHGAAIGALANILKDLVTKPYQITTIDEPHIRVQVNTSAMDEEDQAESVSWWIIVVICVILFIIGAIAVNHGQ